MSNETMTDVRALAERLDAANDHLIGGAAHHATIKEAADRLRGEAAPEIARAKVEPPEWPGENWNPMETAPRDGTMLRLLVDFTENATEDSDRAPTIGSNGFDNTGMDEWDFAGWNWQQDCYTHGEGTPVGWLPMLDKDRHDRAAAPAPVAGDAVGSNWAPISDLPNSDDLFWFARRDRSNSFLVDGPREPAAHGGDADRWDWFAPCVSPSLTAALAQDRASQSVAAGVPEGWRLVPANDLQALAGELQRLSAGVGAIAALADLARRLAAASPSAPTHGAEGEVQA